MRVVFADDDLARILTDEAHRMRLPFAVIRTARNRLVQLEAARDERDLRAIKSLNYKKRQASPDGRRSIRINDQYRIEFLLSEGSDPPVITVVEIGDTH